MPPIPRVTGGACGTKRATTSDALVAGYDIMTTLADIAGAAHPKDKDGVSYLPVLNGEAQADPHDYVVYASFEGPGLVSHDNFKLRYVRMNDTFELYDLTNDYQERHNLAAELPEKTADLAIKPKGKAFASFPSKTPSTSSLGGRSLLNVTPAPRKFTVPLFGSS